MAGAQIKVFEPNDTISCDGVYDYSIDDDGDGYSNADEIDNATDPCSAASLPADFDGTYMGGFLVSNLNDTDNDDDGLNDRQDAFPWDPENGLSTTLPIDYPLLNIDPGTGFYGLGFTGLMTDKSTDYLDLIADENNSSTEIIAGGASGLFSQNFVAPGIAYGPFNNQRNAFQFGFHSDSTMPDYVAEVRINGPIYSDDPDVFQMAGFYMGTGDQNNYLMVVVFANYGNPIMYILREVDGSVGLKRVFAPGVGDSTVVRLGMRVFPQSGHIQPVAALDATSPMMPIATPIPMLGDFRNAIRLPDKAVALGLMASTFNSDQNFNVTWDYIKIAQEGTTAQKSAAQSFDSWIYPNPFDDHLRIDTEKADTTPLSLSILPGRSCSERQSTVVRCSLIQQRFRLADYTLSG